MCPMEFAKIHLTEVATSFNLVRGSIYNKWTYFLSDCYVFQVMRLISGNILWSTSIAEESLLIQLNKIYGLRLLCPSPASFQDDSNDNENADKSNHSYHSNILLKLSLLMQMNDSTYGNCS